MKKFESISKQLVKGTQSLIYQESANAVQTISGSFNGSVTHKETLYKVRISIKSDAYKNQCHATIEVWHAESLSWNSLSDIHFDKMSTSEGLLFGFGNKTADELFRSFQTDRNKLVKDALRVLF